MKNDIVIESASEEEVSYISKRADERKEKVIPLLKGQVVDRICKVIKDSDGNVIAGIIGFINNNLKSTCIDLLWVKEEFRNRDYGTILLKQLEEKALEKEAKLLYFCILGFQAKDFYIKKGYEVFAVLEKCAINSEMYCMKKILKNKNDRVEIHNIIEDGTDADIEFICSKIVDINSNQVTFINKTPFQSVSKVIKDSDGNIVAGVAAYLMPWYELNIAAIWKNDNPMPEELIVKLLIAVEKEMLEKGGIIAFHETFNIEIVDFLTENGYEIYGILDNHPLDYKTYYLKKDFEES